MATSQEVAQIFPTMAERLIPSKAEGVNATIQFNLTGDNGGLYWLRIADGKCEAGQRGPRERAAHSGRSLPVPRLHRGSCRAARSPLQR